MIAAVFPQAVILDFDGLIVDTELSIFEEWQRVYRRHGQELGLDLWQQTVGSHAVFQPAEHLARLTGQALDLGALRDEVERHHHRRCGEQPLLPGVEPLLNDALEAGLGTAVASSSSAGWVESWLVHHGIRDRIGNVCTRDDVERVKPAPDLFLLAARRLGASPEDCIVFEDSPNGARAAVAAGMACVVVPNTVTEGLRFPEGPLRLPSLAARTLKEIVATLRDPAAE